MVFSNLTESEIDKCGFHDDYALNRLRYPQKKLILQFRVFDLSAVLQLIFRVLYGLRIQVKFVARALCIF